jgi:hypothetical protein
MMEARSREQAPERVRRLEHIPLESIRFERQEYAPAFESGAISGRPGDSTRWTSALARKLTGGNLKMAYQAEDFQKYGKEQLEALTSSSSLVAKSWQTIAAESTEYSKKSLENGSAFLEKLLGVKSMEGAIQVQLEYSKTLYEGHAAFMAKLTELYSKLAKDAFAPVDSAMAKVQASKE